MSNLLLCKFRGLYITNQSLVTLDDLHSRFIIGKELNVHPSTTTFYSTSISRPFTNSNRTATGPDGIPYWIWKDYAEIFTPVVETIWNMSLANQYWPTRWKVANISPLGRIDIPTEYPDLRGINVTPIIARTFERTVYQTFNKNNLEGYLNVSQFAYRTGGIVVFMPCSKCSIFFLLL
jgi:hypothetical protein